MLLSYKYERVYIRASLVFKWRPKYIWMSNSILDCKKKIISGCCQILFLSIFSHWNEELFKLNVWMNSLFQADK